MKQIMNKKQIRPNKYNFFNIQKGHIKEIYGFQKITSKFSLVIMLYTYFLWKNLANISIGDGIHSLKLFWS